MRSLILSALVLLSFSLLAQPTITSVTPSSGPVAGGTVVTITGTGFTRACTTPGCTPAMPRVSFGETLSPSVTLISDTHLQAVTPAHLPATTYVRVSQANGSAFRGQGFTFNGRAEEAFEPILLPVFTAPVYGAHGSRFETRLTGSMIRPHLGAELFGLSYQCIVTCIPANAADNPILLQQGPLYDNLVREGTPGRLIYVPRSEAAGLSLNLRAFDVSRSATNYGTEIPVVRQRDFHTDRIVLNDVPLDPRFRNTLRIYSMSSLPIRAMVTIGDVEHEVVVSAAADLFTPGYAELSNFPIGAQNSAVRVTIEGPLLLINPSVPQEPLWAFITVTNNETQHITTITPN